MNPDDAGQFALERAIRQDKVIIAVGLAAITLLAWGYLLRMAVMMSAAASEADMHIAMGMTDQRAWGAADLVTLFLMWTIMMIGMMVPSAAPVILLVTGTYRRRGERSRALTVPFIAGYLIAWTVFSAVAAVIQIVLHRTALLSPSMASSSAALGGAILIAAGAYQWFPSKHACLTHLCRSPLAFLSNEWREGAMGALTMGFRHGMFCVGCCWALMAVLFAVGVMNVLWVAAIAIFVLIEKLAPHGAHVARVGGVALIVWGVWVIAAGA
jgi:predicted metal-binding membrane protein